MNLVYLYAYILFSAMNCQPLAVKYCRLGAENGDAECQNELGVRLLQGRGIEQNKEEAVFWFQQSANLENQYAQLNLGAAYHEGSGVLKDIRKASHWYQQAADQGNGMALYNLGTLYENGDGVLQDVAAAKHYYQKAALKGVAEAVEALEELS